TTRDPTGLVAGLKVGGTYNIVVFRNEKEKTFRVHIAKRDDDKIASRRTPKESEDELGIRVENITPEMKRQFNISEAVGVIVSGVKPGGKGAQAGIMVGDIIKEVNHTSIKSVNEYQDIVNQVNAGGAVQMFIKRVNAGFLVIKLTK
nr:PDZ domain-containing protein [Deltaproteobacteria bacterium]